MNRKLSIIIPAYNESVYIQRCLDNVCQVHIPGWDKEIIVVDDGSTDDTLKVLKEFNKSHNYIRIVTRVSNRGKGDAVRRGIQLAGGDIVLIQDADLEYDPNDYADILLRYNDDCINVVYGSRILGAKMYHNYNANFIFYLGGKMLTGFFNRLFRTTLTDLPTCYKSWRNSLSGPLLEYCRSNGFEFEVEMTAFLAGYGDIAEVPIHYYPRTVSHGKKIRFKDFVKCGLTAVRCALRSEKELH